MMFALVLLFGCRKVDPAPTELTELCAWLFREHSDEQALSDGLAQLDQWLADRGPPSEKEGFGLPPLSEADVAEIDHPDRDLSAAIGAVADTISVRTLDQHAAFVMLPDQSVVDPSDYDKFDRTFLSGGDCFEGRGCELTETWNDIVKNGAFGVTIPYEYGKDYRWSTYTDPDGEEGEAVVSRGWVPESSFGEDGKNGILQSFTVDVFLRRADGESHRVQAQWTELELSIPLSEEQQLSLLIDGLHDVFDDTDRAIEEQGL